MIRVSASPRAWRFFALAVVIAQTASLGGCATRHAATFPTSDYSLTCADIAAQYALADAAATDRKAMARRADISIGATAVALALAIAPPVGLAAIALQPARSDFGYANFAEAREHYRDLSMSKGCPADELAQKHAELGSEPAASNLR